MKTHRFVLSMLIAACLCTGANVGFAQKQADHPAPDVDGEIWMKSSDLEKKAFLYGAGSALVLEYHVREKRSQEPSKLVVGWVDGLKDISWSDLSNKIDAYYRSHPDKMQRDVFDVIWHEIIATQKKS
ncbi:hypothetical protein [Solidesulfovibrio sp.]